jgi:hypothetical protein
MRSLVPWALASSNRTAGKDVVPISAVEKAATQSRGFTGRSGKVSAENRVWRDKISGMAGLLQVRQASALAAEAEHLRHLDCTFHRAPWRHRSHILPKAAGCGFRIPTLYHRSEYTQCLVSSHAHLRLRDIGPDKSPGQRFCGDHIGGRIQGDFITKQE